MRKTYSGYITKLEDNQIFVFGANTQGRHGKGAALIAKTKFGAIYGQARGLQGKCFAIVTKDLTKKIHPSVDRDEIIDEIGNLYELASKNTDKEYLVAYNGVGINLSGYSNHDMANMFCSFSIPPNVIFEESFLELFEDFYKK